MNDHGGKIRDGHLVQLHLRKDGITAEVICPHDPKSHTEGGVSYAPPEQEGGPDRRVEGSRMCAWQHLPRESDTVSPCWVAYMFEEIGWWELVEYQTRDDNDPLPIDGPFEFEWSFYGGEDGEFWWDVVKPRPSVRTEGVFGMEVVKLGSMDDGSPWRMTVDALDGDGKFQRYQVTGQHYEKRERTTEEVARYILDGEQGTAAEKAARLERYDRIIGRVANNSAHIVFRAGVRILHGEDGIKFLDQEGD